MASGDAGGHGGRATDVARVEHLGAGDLDAGDGEHRGEEHQPERAAPTSASSSDGHHDAAPRQPAAGPLAAHEPLAGDPDGALDVVVRVVHDGVVGRG